MDKTFWRSDAFSLEYIHDPSRHQTRGGGGGIVGEEKTCTIVTMPLDFHLLIPNNSISNTVYAWHATLLHII